LWIIKPTNSSQGKGIYIIDDVSEVPIDESCIVSRYIPNPLLINGLKFDLRIYVLVTSYDPLRVYVYNEGLARFASEAYLDANGKTNKYAHLTNYSINKKNEKYQQNMNADQDDAGHKWSLGAFSKHLEGAGVDMNLLWSKIYDVIIKTLLTLEPYVQAGLKKLPSRSNCFELLGFDILVDNDLKPWLMEVNLSPSLATDSPLDLKIKSSLFIDTLNLVGIKKHDRRRDNLTKMKNRVKNIMRAKSYQSRQQNPQSAAGSKPEPDGKKKNPLGAYDDNEYLSRNKLLVDRVAGISSKIREIIKETLQENVRKSNFVRIYPSFNSDHYDQFFQQPRPNNRMLHKYLYSDEIIHFPLGYPKSSPSKTFSEFLEEQATTDKYS